MSIIKRHPAEYKIRWIEEYIGRLFRRTLVDYDMDVMLGIHHWEKMKRLVYRGKRYAITVRNLYSDLKITFVNEVKVDVLFEYGFFESITITKANKKEYTFKESDFSRLNLNDIQNMYVLKVQGKLKHLEGTTEYFVIPQKGTFETSKEARSETLGELRLRLHIEKQRSLFLHSCMLLFGSIPVPFSWGKSVL
uniref:Uncharacterized protein n=1 Tax=Tanacetum cinerariifolium TaxID=118510 RepID=A0A699HND4_TANCI|nr:hypothetical protein [Tanacetum cinerariifolium]